jgi:hypothetical protein
MVASSRVRAAEWSVAVINHRPFGGTCSGTARRSGPAGLTAGALKSTSFAYPTGASDIGYMLWVFGHEAFMVVTESTITCPACGHARLETMPQDACQFFYECTGCGTLLRPKHGHCCVFCSFGSVPCPPVQELRTGGIGSTRHGCPIGWG